MKTYTFYICLITSDLKTYESYDYDIESDEGEKDARMKAVNECLKINPGCFITLVERIA